MVSIALESYAVRVKERNARQNLFLDDLPGGGDLLDVLAEYMYVRENAAAVDEAEQQVLQVPEHHIDGRTISGVLHTGDYGYESPLYNVDQGEVSYTRSSREAGMLPFYFLFRIPQGVDEGLLILQRFGQFGAKTALDRDLTTFLRDAHHEITASINPILAPEVWRSYLREGRLLAIRFIRFTVPDDLASAVGGGGNVEDIQQVELVVQATRNNTLPYMNRIRDFLEDRRHWNDFIELADFEYDTVKVQVVINGHRRTMSLTELGDIRAVYDITDDVEQGDDGHPLFESIDDIARRYLDDMAQGLGIAEGGPGDA